AQTIPGPPTIHARYASSASPGSKNHAQRLGARRSMIRTAPLSHRNVRAESLPGAEGPRQACLHRRPLSAQDSDLRTQTYRVSHPNSCGFRLLVLEIMMLTMFGIGSSSAAWI